MLISKITTDCKLYEQQRRGTGQGTGEKKRGYGLMVV